MKKIVPLLLAVTVVIGVVAYQEYNKPHREIGSESAVASLSADQIFSEFDTDEKQANSKYLDQVVEVYGPVEETYTDQRGNYVLILGAEGAMMGGISATLDTSVHDHRISIGENVKLKGRCTGMLQDVVLINCFPVSE